MYAARAVAADALCRLLARVRPLLTVGRAFGPGWPGEAGPGPRGRKVPGRVEVRGHHRRGRQHRVAGEHGDRFAPLIRRETWNCPGLLGERHGAGRDGQPFENDRRLPPRGQHVLSPYLGERAGFHLGGANHRGSGHPN